MSNTSSSAFNAHSPPYIRRHGGKGRGGGADNRSTTDNLDMEDIYDNVGRKSATDFRGNQPGGNARRGGGINPYAENLRRSGGAGGNEAAMSQDSSSQL